MAFSTKLILLFVSFLFLSLHQISTVDNMRQFSLHITHSYSDILLLSRFSLRSIIYDLSHHDSNTLISPLGYCCRRTSYNYVSSCHNPGVSIHLTASSIWESTYWTNLTYPLPYDMETSFDADIKAVLIKQMRIQNFPCREAILFAALLRNFNYEPGW